MVGNPFEPYLIPDTCMSTRFRTGLPLHQPGLRWWAWLLLLCSSQLSCPGALAAEQNLVACSAAGSQC